MNMANRAAWSLWIAGALLIAVSWLNLVPVYVGWVGFTSALAGTLLSISSQREVKTMPTRPLCETCRLNNPNMCWRPERPTARQCPDYQHFGW
jgi:hypothetical protein